MGHISCKYDVFLGLGNIYPPGLRKIINKVCLPQLASLLLLECLVKMMTNNVELQYRMVSMHSIATYSTLYFTILYNILHWISRYFNNCLFIRMKRKDNDFFFWTGFEPSAHDSGHPIQAWTESVQSSARSVPLP